MGRSSQWINERFFRKVQTNTHGTIFAAAILLSVYRDRLLALPDKIKRREGVFRVFGWR